MLRPDRRIFFLLSCICLLLLPHSVFATPDVSWQSMDGLVVGVSEGDRLTINSFGTEIRVKLYGMIAPQAPKIDKTTGWYKPGQPYAEEAFRALSSKVLHQQVRVEIRRTLINKDEQIALAVVYVDGRNINMEMIAEGWAWVDRKFMTRMDYAHYMAAERLARARKDGLWVQEHPQPPWEFKPEFRIRNRHG
ncbi:MAG TPA: thermonuclease family protein [Geomonas sp.]|nr:thermonuclease family protein [Geomonas sp.]